MTANPSTAMLLAEVVEFNWTAIVTNLGFGGFVMWFAWHTQTHVIPALLLQHREEREQARKDFLQAVMDSRKDYLGAEQTQRSDYMSVRLTDRTDMQSLVAAVTKLAEATNTHVGEARAVWSSQGFKQTETPTHENTRTGLRGPTSTLP